MNTEMRNETETLADQRLFTYDLVILAGGGGTVSLPGQGQRARALAELKGRRLLEYIREAVRQSRRVASVVLVTHSAHANAFRQAAPDLLLCVCDGSMAECAAAAIQKLREQITVIRGVSMRYPGRLKDTQEEHRRLVESIAARNVEKSQEAARIHLENAERTLMIAMSERKGGEELRNSLGAKK